MKSQFDELEHKRKPVGCVHDTADGYLIALLRSGFSHLELRSFFSIGGYGCNRLVQDVANPDLRAENRCLVLQNMLSLKMTRKT